MSGTDQSALDDIAAGGDGPSLEGEHIPHDDTGVGSGVDTAALLYGLLRPAFRMMAPAWDIQDGEVEMLAASYGELVDKWWPDGFPWMTEAAALGVTLVVFGPRLGTPMRRKPAPPPESAPGADG